MPVRPASRAHAGGLDEVVMLVVGTALAIAVTLLTVRRGQGGRRRR